MYVVRFQNFLCCTFILDSHLPENDVVAQANARRADGHPAASRREGKVTTLSPIS